MRVHKLGSGFAVTVSASEVSEWNRCWPCSTLRGSQRFEFDSTGDMVDRSGNGDGEEAVALSQDAQAYGMARLK